MILISKSSSRGKFPNMSSSLIISRRSILEITMFIPVKGIFKVINQKITNFTITNMIKRSIRKIEYFEKMFIFTIIEIKDKNPGCKVEKVTILLDKVLILKITIWVVSLILIILSKNISIFPQIQVFWTIILN